MPGLRLAASALLIAGLLPLRAVAQPSMMQPGPGGYTLQLSDGEPISYFLEHSRELELTDDQMAQLINIRRRLRVNNAPWMHAMDSLRMVMGISLAPTPRLTPDVLEKVAKFQEVSRPISDSLRVLNDAARDEARALLQPDQRVRLDSLLAVGRQGRGRGRGRRPPPPARLSALACMNTA